MRMEDCWNCAIPAWAINALINGNAEGLTLDELALIAGWEDKVNKMYDDICQIEFSVEDPTEFFCDTPEFGLPGTCVCLSVYVFEPII
jgi:hypothetical protein